MSPYAPLGASLVYDNFHSYQPVLWIVLILALGETGVVALARYETTELRKAKEPDILIQQN